MVFREEYEISRGKQRALNHLVPKDYDFKQKQEAKELIIELIYQYGPVISAYPEWHPIRSNNYNRYPEEGPSRGSCYVGLNKKIYLSNGFITCPFTEEDAEKVIESVNNLVVNKGAQVSAERLNI